MCDIPPRRGRLLSLTIRTPPTVRGDGTPRCGSSGGDERLRGRAALYESATLDRVPEAEPTCRSPPFGPIAWVVSIATAAKRSPQLLEARIDAVASSMPNLHVARSDIRFASLAELGQGTFKIIEINGAGSEAIEFFDPPVPFFAAYRGILENRPWSLRSPPRTARQASRPAAGGCCCVPIAARPGCSTAILLRTERARTASPAGAIDRP